MRRRMAAWVAMVPLAVVLGVAQSETATPAVAAPHVRTVASAPTATPSDDRPLVIGDSIAASVASRILRRHPGFFVDAVPGRRVVTLPIRLREHLQQVGVPRLLIIEMGTNTVGSWTKADWRAVVEMVPVSTRIVLVTPYVRPNHEPAHLPRGSRAAGRTRLYTRWETELARESWNVCIDPWRATVARRPSLLTSGGVHPTAAGKRVFLRLLDAAITRCGG